jgi:hypothetical protein
MNRVQVALLDADEDAIHRVPTALSSSIAPLIVEDQAPWEAACLRREPVQWSLTEYYDGGRIL